MTTADGGKRLPSDAPAKTRRRCKIEDLRRDPVFRTMEVVVNYMDKYYLDPVLGLFSGVGDVITSVFSLPFIYYSLVKVRSLPLALAVMFNMVKDVALGMIPFWVGDVIDVFYKSNKKNLDLIINYVNDDEFTVREVKRKAVWSAVGIVVFILAIILLFRLIVWLGAEVFQGLTKG